MATRKEKKNKKKKGNIWAILFDQKLIPKISKQCLPIKTDESEGQKLMIHNGTPYNLPLLGNSYPSINLVDVQSWKSYGLINIPTLDPSSKTRNLSITPSTSPTTKVGRVADRLIREIQYHLGNLDSHHEFSELFTLSSRPSKLLNPEFPQDEFFVFFLKR